MARATRETLALRHEFTNDERLIIGNELASAYNRKAEIEADEAVAKAQIKERQSQVELTIGTLSRNWINGFMIENVICELFWDQPNVGEVSYVRVDNGETVRARAMTEAERQMELSLETPKDVEVSVAASEEAVEEFFEHETGENLAAKYDKDEVDEEESEEGEDEELDEEDQSDAEYDPDLGAIPGPMEPDDEPIVGEEHVPGAVQPKRGRGRPRKNPVASVQTPF